MPIHQSSFISRRALEHPDEQLPTKKPDLLLERVLKYNPNHDPQSGRFSSGGGGRQGGTAGAPTTGAMGQPLGRGAKAKATRERRAAEHAARQQRTNSYQAEMQRQIKEMHGKGVYDPSGSLGGKSTTQRGLDFRPGRDKAGPPKTMEFRPDRDKGQGERQNLPFHTEQGAGPGGQFTEGQKAKNYKEMFGQRETPKEALQRVVNRRIAEGSPVITEQPAAHVRSNAAATPEARLKELDEMTAGYSKQLDEKGIGKKAIRQIRASLGMIQRERTGLQRQMHPDTPARIKELTEMEAGYAGQLGEKGLKKHVARQIRSSLGMIRRERTGLTYTPR